jgi:O-antigen/teichoic acid export membrane protein
VAKTSFTEAPLPPLGKGGSEGGSPRIRLRTLLFGGASLVALANIVERGFLFLANAISARVTGPENYGTYGLALQTAGILASHASLGIGLVALRYAAEFPPGHPQNRSFVQRILQLSLVLALVSSVLMLALAWPLANWFYSKPGLYRVLQVALLTAPVFVLFEALRGLLLGQSYYRGIVFLSIIFGLLMAAFLPLAAPRGPRWMVGTHAVAAFVALGVVMFLIIHRFRIKLGERVSTEVPMSRMLRFGILQVGSGTAVSLLMIGMMALLVRYAPPEEVVGAMLTPLSMVQMDGPAMALSAGAGLVSFLGLREVGYFSAASSLRNLIALIPGLLLQVSYGLMTDRRSESYGGAKRIVLVNTWLSAIFIIPTAGVGMAVMPWLLPLFFGRDFAEGVPAASLLLATATAHTVSQAAVNRISIVKLRWLAGLNILWVLVAGACGWFLIPRLGASGVAVSLLIAHCATMLAVPEVLRLLGELHRGLWMITLIGLAGALGPLALIASCPEEAGLWCWQRPAIVGWSGGLALLLWAIRHPILDIRAYAAK